MKLKYIHKIDATDLRNFCVHHNLFTCGDNEEYSRLFKDARGDVDALHLEHVANRIYVNSYIDDVKGFEGDTFDPETIAKYLITENVLQTYVYAIDD